MMAMYRKCPHCGDNLDPGEKCECELKLERQRVLDYESNKREICLNKLIENGGVWEQQVLPI